MPQGEGGRQGGGGRKAAPFFIREKIMKMSAAMLVLIALGATLPGHGPDPVRDPGQGPELVEVSAGRWSYRPSGTWQ